MSDRVSASTPYETFPEIHRELGDAVLRVSRRIPRIPVELYRVQ